MKNIINFLSPRIIFLIAISLILIVLIIILAIIQKKLKRKVIIIKLKEEEKEETKKEIEKLKNSKESPLILLNSLDILARKFLIETFKIQKNLDYSEMMLILKEKDKDKATNFCQNMLKALYSGRKITGEKINDLINDLDVIIGDEYPKLKWKIFKIEGEKVEEKQQIISPRKEVQKPVKEYFFEYPTLIAPKKIKEFENVDKIASELAETDEEEIRVAYRGLQKKFRQAYIIAEIKKNKENMEKLKSLKKEIIRVVNDYAKDRLKIIDLAHEISKGVKLINSMSS